MSYKININSKTGLKIERLGENLWSAQTRPRRLFTTPKLVFKLDENRKPQIIKNDILRPFLIHSFSIVVILIGIDLISENRIGIWNILYMIFGWVIFNLIIMIMLFYITKNKVLNIKIT